MTRRGRAVLVGALVLAAVVGLAAVQLLLPALVLSAVGAAGWLLVLAWAPPPQVMVPPRQLSTTSGVRGSATSSSRVSSLVRSARGLPHHLLADPVRLGAMSGRTEGSGADVDRTVADLEKVLGP